MDFAPTYQGYLSDHLPMALTAMAQLGVGAELQQAFQRSYQAKLEPLAANATAERTAAQICAAQDTQPDQTWLALIGQRHSYPALAGHLNGWLARQGPRPVLQTVLPLLLRHPGCDAFHGLLRTAYALVAGQNDQLAAGLAYWSSACPAADDVDTQRGQTGGSAKPASLQALMQAQHLAQPRPPPAGAFGDRLLVAMANAEQALPEPVPDGEAAAAALTCYRSSRNFFALHMVTACHGFRLLAPWLPAAAVALARQSLAISLLACHQLIGSPSLETPVLPLSADNFDDDPEHLWKYTFTCREELTHSGDPRYQSELNALVATGLLTGATKLSP